MQVLYDTDYERNKITLIQSVLLMSFWYADTDDRNGSCHWVGVAITLCQTIGMHRNPYVSQGPSRSLSLKDRRLWQHLWWCCVYRDVWFAAGLGRPMRVRLEDCDTPMPNDSSITDGGPSISQSVRDKYFPGGTEDLGLLWRRLLKLTVELAGVLAEHYLARPSSFDMVKLEATEARIRALSIMPTNNNRRLYRRHALQLELYLE
jgi:hypothetical protein